MIRMKKILSIAIVLVVAVSASAQSNEQIQNKNGKDLMPVAGEFAVGIGLTYSNVPQWIGNMFGYTGSNNAILGASSYVNNPNFAGTGASIWGKYMVSDNNALRVSVANFGSDVTTNYKVYDDRANDPDSTVVDSRRLNSSTTYLSAGWEFRRGKSRLRGVYGGEAVLSWQNSHQHYNYGNDLGLSNLTPTQAGAMPNWDPTYGRMVQVRNGAGFGAGIRAFVGVEFFFAPKMSVGTEFGWGVGGSWTKHGTTVDETWDPAATASDGTTGAVVTHQTQQFNQNNFRIDTDNFNGALYFLFWF